VRYLPVTILQGPLLLTAKTMENCTANAQVELKFSISRMPLVSLTSVVRSFGVTCDTDEV
jgi:hypothetical protein